MTNLKNVVNNLFKPNYAKLLENKTVVIMDDDYFFCELLKSKLEKIGAKQVLAYTDELDLLRFLNNEQVDIDYIFLDHNLKYEVGTSLFQKIKSKINNSKVVYMSSKVSKFMKISQEFDNFSFISKSHLRSSELLKVL